MDIDLSFNAMTMTAKQFGEMTKTMMRETMVATGGKQVIDKITEVPALRYYAEMFEKEGVTEEQFKMTYQWYVDHPAELKDVYNDVLAGLQKRVEMTDSTGTAH